jgi:hypothetical protein
VAIAEANFSAGVRKLELTLESGVKTADIKMSTSMAILQNDIDTQVNTWNILTNARSQAFNYRAQGISYAAAAAQSRFGAKAISPGFQGFLAAGNKAAEMLSMFGG